MRERNIQIEDGVFLFFASADGDLLELDDRSDLSSGVLVLGGGGVFLFTVLGIVARHVREEKSRERERERYS